MILKGRTAVLATMHGKEKVIAPILEKEFGIKIILPPTDFDSDKFGTFTRDIKRAGNQLEAARHKAEEALRITGLDLAIASEGIFSPHPQIPFIQSNFELVLLVDKQNNFEVKGHHFSNKTNMAGRYVSSVDEALEFAREIGFPEHGVVVRKHKDSNKSLYKGINKEEDLINKVRGILNKFFVRKVYLETDMRAHMNPTRMENIEKATFDLITNIKSECPQCELPGFSIVDTKKGLICGACGLATESPLAYVKKCHNCDFEKEFAINDKTFEDPSLCSRCNP